MAPKTLNIRISKELLESATPEQLDRLIIDGTASRFDALAKAEADRLLTIALKGTGGTAPTGILNVKP